MHFEVPIILHTHRQIDFDRICFSFLELMVSCMTMSYGFQVAQMNEEPPWESSLDFTSTQHPHDEDPKPREVRLCFKVNPL